MGKRPISRPVVEVSRNKEYFALPNSEFRGVGEFGKSLCNRK